ncbi:MAG: hypothetical protein FWE63_07430 [Bacteroidales bacterium]|nr:hypothetical protein [Bacteroidales bacterium]
MKKRFKNIIWLALWLCPLLGFSQRGGIGQWRDHYSYNNVSSIVVMKNEICGVTENGLFYYDKRENSVRRRTTVQGLSEVGLSASGYDPSTQIQIVGYQSGNIDLIQNGRVINIPGLKNKQMQGSKRINKIVVENSQKVYLCCDFGIVVLNLVRREISETYFIGPNNSSLQINDLALGDSTIYVATESGLLSANRFSNRLNDFREWSEISVNSQNGRSLKSVNLWNENLIVHQLDLNHNDTIWRYFQDQWHVLDTVFTKQIKVSRNRLLQLRKTADVDYLFMIREYGANFQILHEYREDLWGLEDIEIDDENYIWFSTGYNGLTRLSPNWNYHGEVLPRGPANNSVYALTHSPTTLYSTNGSITTTGWSQGNVNFGVDIFDGDWSVFNNQTIRPPHWIGDAIVVAEDPRNPNVFAVASWWSGVVQSNADGSTTIYDGQNSTLGWYYYQSYRSTRCGDVKFDKKNQLWVTNAFVDTSLHKRTPDGHWRGYTLASVTPDYPREFIVDYYDQLWIRTGNPAQGRLNGLVFFKETATGFEALSANLRNGNTQNVSSLNCLVEDKKGYVWLGTDRGILVNYTSRQLFNNPNGLVSSVEFKTINYEGRPLLENEYVTAIAVDGADRKWIGTSSSGVFLMSADGREKIHQFNTDNSPLNSNTITALAINPKTGEVFIGTDKGLMSYGGDATVGSRTNQNMVIFPNPVPADFTGEIAIRGLAQNAKVHITDVSGRLVFETEAKGGMATWNGHTRNGQRAKPGVYVVFSVLADEEEGVLAKGVGKIFINK